VVIIRPGFYTPEERALVVTILKVQDEWECPLKWREEPEVEA